MLTDMHYKIILTFLYSAFATYVAIEYFREKLVEKGHVVEDRYKKNNPKIPTMGGLAMFTGIIIALALAQLIIAKAIVGQLFIFYFIVTVYTLYGIVDDLFGFKKRYDKIIVLLVLSLPIASLISHTSVDVFGYNLYLDGLLPYVIAPVFIMIVANLVNVYSGFNGQSSGLILILLMASTIKSYLLYGLDNLLYVMPILGAIIAFYPFNFYPAKILEGNAGQFMAGSALAAFLVVNKLEFFGFIILIPHTINFILDTIVLAVLKIPDVKFGKIREDGTLEAPVSVRFKSLKFILISYFRITERVATLILYIPTLVFCILGVLVL
jgi:UDP-N-acetylglucosamine--dolichyl-phosphate N-acetylglucosaminephosphotransferase